MQSQLSCVCVSVTCGWLFRVVVVFGSPSCAYGFFVGFFHTGIFNILVQSTTSPRVKFILISIVCTVLRARNVFVVVYRNNSDILVLSNQSDRIGRNCFGKSSVQG